MKYAPHTILAVYNRQLAHDYSLQGRGLPMCMELFGNKIALNACSQMYCKQ